MEIKLIIKLLIDVVLIFALIIIVINHTKPSCKNCVNLRNENREKFYGYTNEGSRYIGWKNCPYKEFDYAPKHCALYEPRNVKRDKDE